MASVLIKNAMICAMNSKLFQGDILILDGRITEIARNIEMAADKVIDAAGKVVMPGFVNAHTHVGMSLFRGYADDMELSNWLKKAIWPIEDKMTDEDTYYSTALALIEMIKTGTTCSNDMYFNCEGTIR